MTVDFNRERRQQFLTENSYTTTAAVLAQGVAHFSIHPYGSGRDDGERSMLARMSAARDSFRLLLIRFTAGAPLEPLRQQLEQVVVAYERYGDLLWTYRKDRNEVVFEFTCIDDYCELMQLIGLCFLLHRRDLLPRIAALQDGLDAAGQDGEGNGGTDTLYEEFMAHGVGAQARYDTDWLCCSKPYRPLFRALTEATSEGRLKQLDGFLKNWYKDLAGTGWHDSHKPDDNGNQGGYYGYWSFEAGAAVILLGIEDDSSLHKYLYYPKDLVTWCRANAALSDPEAKTDIPLRCLAGQPCPRSGFWFTPAAAGKRQRFAQGDVMPDLGGAYGATVWQWDERQGEG